MFYLQASSATLDQLPRLLMVSDSAGDQKRIGAFLARMKRQDFLPPQSPDADQMADRADERLFLAVLSNKNHVLHSQLPVKRLKSTI